MGYESLSTVVVLVIVVIIMAGWLPTRTVKGMRKVAEHREDRYSSSLHLVDKDSGTRFSDERTPPAKGIIMQSDHTRGAKYSSEHIARVRQLRRAAIRRRRIIVITLLAITVLVLGISFPLKFSPLFALIPAALLAVVLALCLIRMATDRLPLAAVCFALFVVWYVALGYCAAPAIAGFNAMHGFGAPMDPLP